MFLSPGEKILKYRKHYKIKQEDITGDKVSKKMCIRDRYIQKFIFNIYNRVFSL